MYDLFHRSRKYHGFYSDVVGYVRMFEEAIGELVRLSEEESVLYSCKSLGYTRKEKKTDLLWGNYRESIRLVTKYTNAYFLV